MSESEVETTARSSVLLVDCGNSQIKWSWLTGRELGPIERIDHIKKGLPARMFKAWSKHEPPERAIVSCVCSPSLREAMAQWFRDEWTVDAEFIVPRRRAFGVHNAYAVPERLGCDRWLALIAARSMGRRSVCIVDCGTAITVDAIDDKGRHRGGLILPGLHMMMNTVEEHIPTLTTGTAPPPVDSPPAIDLLAADTQPALLGGAVYATIAAIDRIVDDVCAALGRNADRILTGGDAVHLLPLLAHDYRHVPELVFDGLVLIARQR